MSLGDYRLQYPRAPFENILVSFMCYFYRLMQACYFSSFIYYFDIIVIVFIHHIVFFNQNS